jgi:hypothetical protein
MANKSSWVKLRVTSDEKAMIEQKANSAGLSTSKFIRNMANDAKVYEKYDRLISGQLKRIGNNLNQITKRVNAGLTLKPEIQDALRRVILAIEDELKR